MANQPIIEFLEIKQAYDPSGSPRAASLYTFLVGRKVFTVEVATLAVSTCDGQMAPEKVRKAAEAFLEFQAERFGWTDLSGYSVLNDAAMDVVIRRLRWTPRFGS
jgi:hypothetical protein